MKQKQYTSVLSIAGFDGSGGAGLQADTKTISSIGCYATNVLTALTVQNTCGVRSIYPMPTISIKEQIECILDDIPPKTIKIGMVHSEQLVFAIKETLSKYPGIPIVFDPVMVATSGDKLIEEQTITAITEHLFPMATLITPNLDEAGILANIKIETVEQMREAGKKIKELGCSSILLKGGHLAGSIITSLYFASDGSVHEFTSEKTQTKNTHGSGCSLSSAIASYLALGNTLLESISLAQDYVIQAIEAGKDVKTGEGNGPLNHFFNPQKLHINELVN